MCIGQMRGSYMRASHVASSAAAMIADGLRCASGLIAMLRHTGGRARLVGSIRISAPGARSGCLGCIATRGDNGFRDRPLNSGLGSRG
jgi:hypothetical protein